MEKTNIRRLIGVMMPFMIMVIVQRLGLLLLPELPAFVIASAAGIFFFRMSCGADVLRFSGSTAAAREKQEDSDPTVPPFRPGDTVLGRILWIFVCMGVLIVFMHIVAAVVGGSASEPVPSAAEALALILIHPFLEEYIFRWLYYRELRPMHPFFAGLAQAVMFAIVHGSVGGMVYALFAGIVLAVALEYSGSLAVTVAAHALVNLRSFVYAAWLADEVLIRTILDFCVVSVGFGAFLGLLVRRGLREFRESAETEAKTDDGQ
ncbi:MAG: CPBP family intramembrane metalloprotease [Clostridia bacterium]|nr:CPBP family intramembrane metalloprotease [Clostridia bacterium]